MLSCSDAPENVLLCTDLQKALEVLSKPPYDQSIEHVYITGGYGVYKVTIYLYSFKTVVPPELFLGGFNNLWCYILAHKKTCELNANLLSQFQEAMSMPNLHRIYLTEVHMDVECDAFYPEFDEEDFNIVRLVNVNMHTPFCRKNLQLTYSIQKTIFSERCISGH